MFWIFPAVAIQYAQLDAQWAVCGVVLVGVLIAWIHGLENERFPNMTGADPAQLLFGKFVGKLVIWIYVPFYILFVSLSIFFTINIIKYYFPDTPKYVFVLMFLAVGWRGAWMGIETLARVSAIIHPFTFLGLLITFSVAFFKSEHHWLPHKIVNFGHVGSGIYHLLPLYFGIDIVLTMSPYYIHAKRKSLWYPIYGAIASGFILLLVFASIVSTLGWIPAAKLLYPTQMEIQLIRIDGFIIERLGIVIIILSVAFSLLFVSNHIWSISATISRLFNRSDHDYRKFSFFVVPVIFIMSMMIRNGAQARDIINIYLAPVSVVLMIGFPLVKIATSMIRGIRTDDREEIRKGRR